MERTVKEARQQTSQQLIKRGFVAAGLLGTQADEFLLTMPEDRYEAAMATLQFLLEEETRRAQDDSQVAIADNGPENRSPLNSKIFDMTNGGDDRVVLFNIKETFMQTWLPLASLVSVLSAESAGTKEFADVIRTVMGVWENLVILRKPQDAHAIEAVRAIGVLTIRGRAATSPSAPTSADIAVETGLCMSDLAGALTQLTRLKAVENAGWGARPHDLNDPDHRWKIAL